MSDTIKGLLERQQERKRQRIIRRFKNIASVAFVTACIGYLIYLELPALAESKEPVSVPETPKEVSVVSYAAPVATVAISETVEEPVVATTKESSVVEPVSLGEFKITYYCACSKCCGEWADGITATGTTATEGRTIAVDPKVIPYGTEVTIRYQDGTEHTYISEDCGGAIKGNRIDVFMESHEAALVAGVKYGEVFVNGR